MKCRYCGYTDSKVIDSRPTDDGNSIRRRRECPACGKRFTTYEIVEDVPIIVVKRSGAREQFNRDKLLNSMIRAVEKRRVTVSQLEKAVDEIMCQLQNNLKREVPSSEIAEMAMSQLKILDEVAYVRFFSVYRQFKDLESFKAELDKLLENESRI